MSDLRAELAALRQTLREAIEAHEQGLPNTARMHASFARTQAEVLTKALHGYLMVGPLLYLRGFDVSFDFMHDSLKTACRQFDPERFGLALDNAMFNLDRTFGSLSHLAVHDFPAAS